MRKFSLLFIVFILMLGLSSCKIGNGGEDDSGDAGSDGSQNSGSSSSGDSSDALGGNYIWKRGDLLTFALADPADTDASAFIKELSTTVGGGTALYDGTQSAEHVISVGLSEHPISGESYKRLYRFYSTDPERTAFLIYSDGTSVGIAYESELGKMRAVEYFLKEYNESELSLRSGIVYREEFDMQSYANKKRAEARAQGFSALVEKIGADAASLMLDIASLSDEKLYLWLANLYCPDVGGFYYSNSARDNLGFLPDIESTVQALSYLEGSGLLENYENSYENAVTGEWREELLQFAKGLQSPVDGYFYHPQWGSDITTSRRGRDLGWATQLIKALGDKPYYDTPNGHKGSEGAPPGEDNSAAPVAYVLPFASARGADISRAVTAVASSTLPEYLRDLDKWKEYLEGLNLNADSYKAGNTLDAINGQVGNASAEIKNYLHEFLDSHQFENGVWEAENGYNAINGLMKISGVYDSLGWTIPNAEAALMSAIEVALTPEGAAHVCSVYNPWVAMNKLISSVKKSEGSAAADSLRDTVKENLISLVRVTYEKISVFKKSDGGFSYFINYCSDTSQGATVAVMNSAESDVNATGIASFGILRNIYQTLGVSRVRIFTGADYECFYRELSGLGTILKNEVALPELITFDGYTHEYGDAHNGIVGIPDAGVTTYVGDPEIGADGNYKWFMCEMVKNPALGAGEDDIVLHGKSFVYSGEKKNKADAGSSYRFPIANLALQSTNYVFEADMLFASASADAYVGQFFFGNSSSQDFSLNIRCYTYLGEKYIRFGENYQGLDGTKDDAVAGGIPLGEWARVRIEAYKIYKTDESGKRTLDYKAKVFVNGEYQGECDAGYVNQGAVKFSDRTVNRAALSFYRHASMDMYLNNVLVGKIEDKYVSEAPPLPMGSIPNEQEREINTLEDGLLNTSTLRNMIAYDRYGTVGYLLAAEEQSYNPAFSASVTSRPHGESERALKISVLSEPNIFEGTGEYKYGTSKTELLLGNNAQSGTAYTARVDFLYDSESVERDGELSRILFTDCNGNVNYALRIKAYVKDGAVTLGIIENNNEDGCGVGRVLLRGISADTWHTLSISLSTDTDGAVLAMSLDGGEAIYDTTYRYSVKDGAPLQSVSILHNREIGHTLYLDNLSFMKAVESDIEPPTAGEGDAVTDFEGTGLGSALVNSFMAMGEDAGGKTVTVNAEEITDMSTLIGTYTTFFVETDPTNPQNKVLKVQKVQKTNASGSTAIGSYNARTDVLIANPTADGDTFTFTADINIGKRQYDTTYISFMDTEGKQAVRFRIYLPQASNVSFYQANSQNTTGNGVVAGLDGENVTFSPDVWYTLKIEMYKGERPEDTRCKIFLGLRGLALRCVADISAYDFSMTELDIAKVAISHQALRAGTVMLDNLSLVRSNTEYVKAEPPTLSDEPVADFESGELSTKYLSHSFVYHDAQGNKITVNVDDVVDMSKYAEDHTTFYVTDDPTGAANKVLKVQRVKQLNSSNSANADYYTRTSLRPSSGEGDVITLELDFYLASVQYDTTYISFTDTAGNKLLGFRIYLTNVNTVKLYLQNEGTNRKESVASLSPKTWYRLKIEFSRSSVEEENLVRVYVGEAGGECALVFEDNVYNKITSYDFDKVIFGHYTLRAGCLYLDNMSVSLSSKGSDASSEE